ncbi:MAG: pitrilysin family protein [Candidatus Dojkabacteria bacterium]|nr:pitrilysin family protein [Candidatus Dojkabacteria bacterium]
MIDKPNEVDTDPTHNSLSAEDLGTRREETFLSNGSKLVVLERPRAPIHLRAVSIGGARFDPPGQEGTAHFLEHMLLAGTPRFPTKDRLAAYIERYGGEIGATTGWERLSINSTVADPDDLGVCVDLMHEMLLDPLFDPRTVEMERGAILRELGAKVSSPEKMLMELYPRLFFGGTDLGRSILGTPESIRSISRDDLIRFYKEVVTSGRLLFVACGGTQVHDLKDHAEQSLLVPASVPLKAAEELPLPIGGQILVERYPGLEQVHILFGFRFQTSSEADNLALEMIAESLGGGRASSLKRLLRYERGLTYEASAGAQRNSDSGRFLIKTSTSRQNVQEVLDVLAGEIRRVVTSGLSQEELVFGQTRKIKSLRMRLQDSRSWVEQYSDWERGVGGPFGIKAYSEAILRCTPEATQRAAQKYFGSNSWYLAMCGDIEPDDVTVNL